MSVSVAQVSRLQARTRAAILAATATVLGNDRLATVPDIAHAAGVGRTTVHRYFSDRERLIYEATLDSIRLINEAVSDAATDQGSAVEAMHRLITALVSTGDRILFLFGDPAVMRNVASANQPNDAPIIAMIKRGQREGVFDRELSPTWIGHALFGLVLKGCEDANAGALPRHTIAPLVIRTFEHGICSRP